MVCNEFQALRRRGFRDYSKGHQRMYLWPIEILRSGGRRYTILDVGFGIGWGLERMLEAGIVQTYVGIEPVAESFQYVEERCRGRPDVKLIQGNWLTLNEGVCKPADFTFCIEVVEHLATSDVHPFLSKLRRFTLQNLFLSTPDRHRSRHGTRSTDEWISALTLAGFRAAAISTQWTTFFLCEPSPADTES